MNTVPPGRAASNGFSLIELLKAVTILAILAAIALPNYQHYIQRSHRSQARAALLHTAQWMERVATAMACIRKPRPPARRFHPR